MRVGEGWSRGQGGDGGGEGWSRGKGGDGGSRGHSMCTSGVLEGPSLSIANILPHKIMGLGRWSFISDHVL